MSAVHCSKLRLASCCRVRKNGSWQVQSHPRTATRGGYQHYGISNCQDPPVKSMGAVLSPSHDHSMRTALKPIIFPLHGQAGR